jgi:hypothetical protein
MLLSGYMSAGSGFLRNVLSNFTASEYSTLLNIGVSRYINTYDMKEHFVNYNLPAFNFSFLFLS